MVRELVPATFRANVSRQTENVDVLALTAPSGKPPALIKTSDPSTVKMDDGTVKITECSLRQLALILEGRFHVPVADETGIGDEYHLKLNYEGDAQGLPDAIKKTGLNADFVHRPVEFLVVAKEQ